LAAAVCFASFLVCVCARARASKLGIHLQEKRKAQAQQQQQQQEEVHLQKDERVSFVHWRRMIWDEKENLFCFVFSLFV